MNVRPEQDPRRPRRDRARHPGAAHRLGAALTLLLCGFAQAQDDGLARLVTADAARLLHSPDPLVRGEAALVVSAGGANAWHGRIAELTTDPDPAARARAIVAVGLQSAPGSPLLLADLLDEGRGHTSTDRTAAAFAVGLLAPDLAGTLTSSVLTGFLRGNLRREQDPLLALLLGLAQRDPQAHAASLLRVYDDDSLRDARIRAQLLHLLLRAGHTFDLRQLRRLLERSSADERTALLRWFADGDAVVADDLLPVVERLARQGGAGERAAALATLTRRRHLPALEIAARAMRSSDAVECGQGLRSVLAIGGAGMRRALERHLIAEDDPVRKTALLTNFAAPPSTELLAHAAALAADGGQPFDVRTAGAVLVARSDPARAAPLLRDLFRATTRTESLPQLAALLAQGGEPPPLEKLLHGPCDLVHHPAQWQALLAVEHPAAVRQLLATLEPRGDAAAQGLALQAWRRARVLSLPLPVVGEPPATLRAALGD
ncbi:MAG: hypothetical protein JNL08_18775 [Planctomycetes bacterium]|nr:hypothetical protein [Planctomycetota bacterium]